MLRKIFSSSVTLILAVMIFAWTFGRVVPPGEMGVRQINFGPYQGFSEVSLKPGYHWSIPFYSRIITIPTKKQILNLNRDHTRYGDSTGSIEVQTTDGSSVDVDFSVISSFATETTKDSGGPSQLITRIGITPDVWKNHLRRLIVDELKRSLGRLSTGQFYNPELREAEVLEAQNGVNGRLSEYGMKVDAILLRRYTYTEERIDQAVFLKNLQEQEERLNVAASKLAEAKAELEQVAAEWDAKIQNLKVKGDNDARVVLSQGDLYEAQKHAAGDLEVAKAIASVDKLRADALSQNIAAEILVARELSPLLGSLKGGVVSGIDPYDLDGWIKRFGVEAK